MFQMFLLVWKNDRGSPALLLLFGAYHLDSTRALFKAFSSSFGGSAWLPHSRQCDALWQWGEMCSLEAAETCRVGGGRGFDSLLRDKSTLEMIRDKAAISRPVWASGWSYWPFSFLNSCLNCIFPSILIAYYLEMTRFPVIIEEFTINDNDLLTHEKFLIILTSVETPLETREPD